MEENKAKRGKEVVPVHPYSAKENPGKHSHEMVPLESEHTEFSPHPPFSIVHADIGIP